MNRRGFIRNLAGIGVFSILPGAGRIWKARRPHSMYRLMFLPQFPPPPLPLDLKKIFEEIYALQQCRRREQERTEDEILWYSPSSLPHPWDTDIASG
jgi:hypothetical protein